MTWKEPGIAEAAMYLLTKRSPSEARRFDDGGVYESGFLRRCGVFGLCDFSSDNIWLTEIQDRKEDLLLNISAVVQRGCDFRVSEDIKSSPGIRVR